MHGAGRNSTVQNQDGKGKRKHQGRLHAGRILCTDSAAEREDSFVVWRSWAIINFILGTAAREATVCEMQIHFTVL